MDNILGNKPKIIKDRTTISRIGEIIISGLIKATGYSAIVFVLMIFYFLLSEGMAALSEVPLTTIFSTRWYPVESYFGILPLIGGSLLVTIGATLFAVPIGILTAVFIAEIAPRWLREVLKPLIEILAGLPSVLGGQDSLDSKTG